MSLDPDVAQKVKSRMERENASFKQVVNDALRRGLEVEVSKSAKPFRVTAHSFGLRPGIDIHKLNQAADDLEIEAFRANAARAKKRR